MGVGVRRGARRFALQVLYALDVNPMATVAAALSSYREAFDLELDERAREFAEQLIRGTVEQRAEVDEIIQRVSRNWRLDRMSRVDRNILRLATYELNGRSEVPTKVIINEAVELAKRFGAAEAPAFVNGILDRVAQALRTDRGETGVE